MRKPSQDDLSLLLFDVTTNVAADIEPQGEQLPNNDAPPDVAERSRALNPAHSFLVQAPAGSGKTHLLTQRFLRLLGQAEKPDEIVAITFTNAAAAEMRHRILDELEKAEAREALTGALPVTAQPFPPESLEALASRALARAHQAGWPLLDQPAQLRITTIDAFCRNLALLSPLDWGQLSGMGGRLDVAANPNDLYRRAAAGLMQQLLGDQWGGRPSETQALTRQALEALMLWRDNNWSDVEELIVQMLSARNRWFQDFVLRQEKDWVALRKQLEAPFCRAARKRLRNVVRMLDNLAGTRELALELARYACLRPGKLSPLALAERAELPSYFLAQEGIEESLMLEDALEGYRDLACFLVKQDKQWRTAKGLNASIGFPPSPETNANKGRFAEFIEALSKEPGLLAALVALREPMPTRYTDEDWALVQHCFRVLRAAAGELQLVFAQTGSVDFTEVAQIALRIMAPEDGFPSDFAMRQADGIRHLLIDEFQDTSRSQHQLLSSLIAAWPERDGRSCFCVGDPMQSIYGFREAEVELFERLKTNGLEMASPDPASGRDEDEAFPFDFVTLRANFRTTPSLVADLNERFDRIFAEDDGSGVRFSSADPARKAVANHNKPAKTELHLAFTARKCLPDEVDPLVQAGNPELTRQAQLAEIVALIQSKLDTMAEVKAQAAKDPAAHSAKYRIAVLGRTKRSLILIADALRKAKIGYRAIELVPLAERPEVLDALSLARALLNPANRTAWLGVLRAPWCGLTLADLHLLTSADDREITATAVPVLLNSRLDSLFAQGLIGNRAYQAASRVNRVLKAAIESRASAANLSLGITLGTWLESIWKALGGGDTVTVEQRANLSLLWAALDKLPDGELDLLGPALTATLGQLCALPDPGASSDFGVQLMTIHKSKGLEFEVVLVPDLEADSKQNEKALISWLERGVADPETEETALTEFLIAPIQPKGEKAGMARKWVEAEKSERSRQELRRLLYVAATRAREELHLFARPRYSIAKSSTAADSAQPTLAKASGLLATAWPAFHEEIEIRFDAWLSSLENSTPIQDSFTNQVVSTLAAGAAANAAAGAAQPDKRSGKLLDNLVTMPTTSEREASVPPLEARPALLRRLPENYVAPTAEVLTGPFTTGAAKRQRSLPTHFATDPFSAMENGAGLSGRRPLYARTEGGLESRLEGTAIHTLLERVSLLRLTMEPREASRALASSLASTVAAMRSHGLPFATAQRLAGEALAIAQRSSIDPTGAWIFAPHSNAGVETRWTGMIGGAQQNLRPDRVFLAFKPSFLTPQTGPPILDNPIWPIAADQDKPAWWIVDYKTTRSEGANLADPFERQDFLKRHRDLYSSQLAIYAHLLQNLLYTQIGPSPTENESFPPIYAGIYYPRLRLFDFWLPLSAESPF